jgi:hypothetical protein
LEQLRKEDREAVLLRFYEQRNHQEVGMALGISEEAARKRVNRAIERLRKVFASRGFTLTAASLTALMTAGATTAVPAGLILSVVASTAHSGATGATPALANETIAAWRWFKLKMAGTLVVTTAIVAFLVTTSLPVTSTHDESKANHDVALESPTTAMAGAGTTPERVRFAGSRDNMPGGSNLRLHVFARSSGEPVTNAMLAINTVTGEEWQQRFDLRTDALGYCAIPLPSGVSRLDVGAVASGWEPRFVRWMPGSDDAIPAEYILMLDPVTNSAGGWLRDDAGTPVWNAQIWMQCAGGDVSSRETPRESFRFVTEIPVGRSDSAGYWSCSVIPWPHNGFALRATHEDFAPTEIEASNSPEPNKDFERATFRQLLAGTLITTLKPGELLLGRVVDETGRPVSGAEIVHNPYGVKSRMVHSDDEGRFQFSGLPVGGFGITVTAPLFSPEYRRVEVQRGSIPVEIVLKRGAILRLHAVDEHGMDVPAVTVGLEQWGEHRHVLKWTAETGPDGCIEWSSAPSNASLQVYAKAAGWCYTRDQWVIANGKEHLIRMRRSLTVTGVAVDAETGEPIRELKAFPGYGNEEHAWERLETRHGRDGAFRVEFQENRLPWRVRVEAPGYLPATSPDLPAGFDEVLDLSLQPIRTTKQIAGTVLLPDGRAAAGAEVALCTFEQTIGATLMKGRFEQRGFNNIRRTDHSGRFAFLPDPQAHTLVAVHPAGFARVDVGDANEIRLLPWGNVEGTVFNLPPGGESFVGLADWADSQVRGGLHLDNESFQVLTDSDGAFTLMTSDPANIVSSFK